MEPRCCCRRTHVHWRGELFSKQGRNSHGHNTLLWLLGTFAWHRRIPKSSPSSTPTPSLLTLLPYPCPSVLFLPTKSRVRKKPCWVPNQSFWLPVSALPLSLVAMSLVGNVAGFQISHDVIQNFFFSSFPYSSMIRQIQKVYCPGRNIEKGRCKEASTQQEEKGENPSVAWEREQGRETRMFGFQTGKEETQVRAGNTQRCLVGIPVQESCS